MRLLFKYGLYQSSLNQIILEYNKILEVFDKLKNDSSIL
jgi:hypothetical protein